MSVTKRRIALVLALTAGIMSTAAHMAAQQGPPAPSAAAVADSEAVAATHRSRTLAALFEEFRTTTPDNARINSRPSRTCFPTATGSCDLFRVETSGPSRQSGNPISRFEADAIASFKAGGPGFFARLDRIGPRWLWCEAIALDNGAFLEGTDMISTCARSATPASRLTTPPWSAA